MDSPINIKPKEIQEFRELYSKHSGNAIGKKAAGAKLAKLVRLVQLIQSNQINENENENVNGRNYKAN